VPAYIDPIAKELLMARKLTTDLPGITQYIRQRSYNRQACFSCSEDFEVYLLAVDAARRKHRCDIHAYVLIANHVHLLVTPRSSCGVMQMMDSVRQRYMRYFRRRYKHAGILWEASCRSDVLDVDRELLNRYKQIELKPVQMGIADRPESYPWSSHSYNALGRFDPIITPHALYMDLGGRKDERQLGYRRSFQENILV